MSEIAPDFTMKRMLDDYIDRFYNKLATRSLLLQGDGFAKAKSIAAWKEEVASHWDKFQVESFTCSQDLSTDMPIVGKEYKFNLVIDRHELQGMLGVEMVTTKENTETHESIELLWLVPTVIVLLSVIFIEAKFVEVSTNPSISWLIPITP